MFYEYKLAIYKCTSFILQLSSIRIVSRHTGQQQSLSKVYKRDKPSNHSSFSLQFDAFVMFTFTVLDFRCCSELSLLGEGNVSRTTSNGVYIFYNLFGLLECVSHVTEYKFNCHHTPTGITGKKLGHMKNALVGVLNITMYTTPTSASSYDQVIQFQRRIFCQSKRNANASITKRERI